MALLAVAAALGLMACALGDIFNGPLPYDLSDDEVVGVWEGRDDAGSFEFAADGTLTFTDLPPDALAPMTPTTRLSGKGTWHITFPLGGQEDQRNMVALALFPEPGQGGGWGGRMSASKPDGDIILAMGSYVYTKV